MPKRTLDDIAEASWLKLVNRIAGPLAIALLLWAGNTLESMDKNMAVTMQEIVQQDKRITSLEAWRNERRAVLNYFVTGSDSPPRD